MTLAADAYVHSPLRMHASRALYVLNVHGRFLRRRRLAAEKSRAAMAALSLGGASFRFA